MYLIILSWLWFILICKLSARLNQWSYSRFVKYKWILTVSIFFCLVLLLSTINIRLWFRLLILLILLVIALVLVIFNLLFIILTRIFIHLSELFMYLCMSWAPIIELIATAKHCHPSGCSCGVMLLLLRFLILILFFFTLVGGINLLYVTDNLLVGGKWFDLSPDHLLIVKEFELFDFSFTNCSRSVNKLLCWWWLLFILIVLVIDVSIDLLSYGPVAQWITALLCIALVFIYHSIDHEIIGWSFIIGICYVSLIIIVCFQLSRGLMFDILFWPCVWLF